jgi:hypothetical protein
MARPVHTTHVWRCPEAILDERLWLSFAPDSERYREPMKIKSFKAYWVAALIVANVGLLGAMLAPNFVKARCFRCGGPREACVANMKQIDGAISTWALEQKVPKGTAVDTSELFGYDKYIRVKPECPIGGNYLYNRVGDPVQVKCPNAATLKDHVLPTVK